MTDTIFAPATAAGRSAVAVVRLSGPGTLAAVRALAGRLPAARRASLRGLKGAGGAAIDEALVLWFPAPGSYTGEDSAEFHVHGGQAVVAALVEALSVAGLRLAEPGEFTRRAFEHGKLDLAQAEGVADLIDAETEAQRRQALAQLGGRLSDIQARWRDGLIRASAMLEAAVDFPDEELPADVAGRARPILEILADELETAAADVERGERVREGFRIALVGAPNAGKSSLLNALVDRDAAIVTATPGTTRDVIEVPMVVAGYKVLLADTAGLREDRGRNRGRGRAPGGGLGRDGRPAGLAGRWLRRRRRLAGGGGPCRPRRPSTAQQARPRGRGARQSAGGLAALPPKARDGVAWLERSLDPDAWSSALAGGELPAGDPPAAPRAADRGRDATANAPSAEDEALELAAEDVRLAARALDRVTGRIDAEEVLGQVFASFCIGK